jgi:hypothetical protein
MLELGIAGGRAVPLQKRTVGNTNISDVFDNKNDGIVTVECTAYKGGVIVKAYQINGGDMGVTGQSFVFADKDGWVSEEGMPNKIWVGEAVKYVDRWYKINPVDDSVEGMPNLTI